VKGGKKILNISTPSVDLQHDFEGVDVSVGAKKICSINLRREVKTTKCELMPDPPPPYLIIVVEDKMDYTNATDVFVKLVKSTHCSRAAIPITRKCKAEEEGSNII
jgi:hypothetical protein